MAADVNLDQLCADLQRDEGFVSYPYDDATDKRVIRGYMVLGTVTFGHGLTFLTEDESAAVLRMRVSSIIAMLSVRLPWMATLTERRQRALANMAYNLGVVGLLTFTTFLSLLQSGEYEKAADDLMTTKWASEVGKRATRIEALIREPPLLAA